MFNLIVCRLKNTKKKTYESRDISNRARIRANSLTTKKKIVQLIYAYRLYCERIRFIDGYAGKLGYDSFFFSFYCYKLKCFKTKGEGISEIVMKQHETE